MRMTRKYELTMAQAHALREHKSRSVFFFWNRQDCSSGRTYRIPSINIAETLIFFSVDMFNLMIAGIGMMTK